MAEYDDATGLLRTTYPLTTATDGGPFLVCPVMRRIVLLQHTINFPVRFFASHANATFGDEVSQPMAGIASIVGTLENTAGLLSNEVVLRPASETMMVAGAAPLIPYAMRTGGQTRYSFAMSAVPGGDTPGAFNSVSAAIAQPFERAWAEVSAQDPASGAGPVTPPSPSAKPVLTSPEAGGTITITHTCSGWEQVTVSIGGFSSTWRADAANIRAGNSTAEIAASIQARFAGDYIGEYYGFSVSGSVISVTDSSGRSGLMTVSLAGSSPYTGEAGALTLTSTDLVSVLGILTGRRYAFAFVGGGYRSELSQATVSTGPSGAFGQVLLTGLPSTVDPRVTTLEIYACDSTSLTNAVWRLVAAVPTH